MSESEELARLGELHRSGVLSDEEFNRAKARVLNGAADGGASPVGRAVSSLHRSRSDRWLGGVCGGLGRVTGAPSWVWRLLFAGLFLCAGTGGIFYLLMWIFVPLEPAPVTLQTRTA